MYVGKMELTEISNFRLFAANGKRKRPASVCFLQMESGSLFFGRQKINGNRCLLFQQTCLSMDSGLLFMKVYNKIRELQALQ
jgi:hypothetical protein